MYKNIFCSQRSQGPAHCPRGFSNVSRASSVKDLIGLIGSLEVLAAGSSGSCRTSWLRWSVVWQLKEVLQVKEVLWA